VILAFVPAGCREGTKTARAYTNNLRKQAPGERRVVGDAPAVSRQQQRFAGKTIDQSGGT
jgi:hypothetical protein